MLPTVLMRWSWCNYFLWFCSFYYEVFLDESCLAPCSHVVLFSVKFQIIIVISSLGKESADLTWATSWQNLILPYVNNKGADQPAHPCSLISAFVADCLDSIISLVSISDISSLCLASVAAQAGLSLTWSHTPQTGFLVTRLIYASDAIDCLSYMRYFLSFFSSFLLVSKFAWTSCN